MFMSMNKFWQERRDFQYIQGIALTLMSRQDCWIIHWRHICYISLQSSKGFEIFSLLGQSVCIIPIFTGQQVVHRSRWFMWLHTCRSLWLHETWYTEMKVYISHQLKHHLAGEQELMRHYPDQHTKPASIQEGHCPLCTQGIGHTSGRCSPNM